MTNKVVLIGNGGHAKVITDIVKLTGDEIVGFVVDNEFDSENSLGLRYLGDFSVLNQYANDYKFIVAIGNNEIRESIASKFYLPWYTAVHPTAVIDKTVTIGVGTCVMANAVVNSSSVIGEHCILNTGSIVDHDCIVGSFCHLSPNSAICGAVIIGNNVHVGAGSTVINNTTITNQVTLGAGCCVINDIERKGTYVGVPAKLVEKC